MDETKPPVVAREAPEELRMLLHACGQTPAFVHDRRTQVLAASVSAAQLSPCFVPGTSLVRALFLDQELRALLADDWETIAGEALTGIASAVRNGDPAAERIVTQLSRGSAEFRRRWPARQPGPPSTSGLVRLMHPAAGPLGLRYQRLLVPRTADRPGAVLTVLHRAPEGDADLPFGELMSGRGLSGIR
jgi:hypothetical protein